MNERGESCKCLYQLILISRDRRESRFVKNKSLAFLFLDVGQTSIRFVREHQMNAGLKLVHRVQYDLPALVQLVIRQLDLLEGDDLPPSELLPGVRAVRMRVEPVRRGRVGLAGHQPRGPMVGVAIPLIVAGHDVQHDGVMRRRIHAGEAASHRREHPPVIITGEIIQYASDRHAESGRDLARSLIVERGKKVSSAARKKFPYFVETGEHYSILATHTHTHT